MRNTADKINTTLASAKRTNSNVYIFGAHVFTQMLIAFGVDEIKIDFILDNDPHKIGKRLSGTSLYVASPQVLQGIKTPWVIVKVGAYAAEIRQNLLGINPGVVFIE